MINIPSCAIGVVIGMIAGTGGMIVYVFLFIRFRHPIEQAQKKLEQVIQSGAPRPKGFIIEPASEAQEAREEIIQKNKKLGKDTKLAELYENTED